tara:strand:+ start:1669 stop:2400 length:732 start_codon:yes stop_codon:yes gene_type:complete
MKISLLCPSRERLNKFITFTSSVFATCKDIDNIELVLGVDSDDSKKESYKRIANNLSFIKYIELPEGLFKAEGLSGIWNQMATECTGDLVAMVGDDMIFQTIDWDEKIIEAFKSKQDNIYLVHCNDGMRGPGNKYVNVPPLAVNSFVHKDYINTVGRYVQTEIKEIFQDTFLDRLFSSIKRKIYYHDIIIKHLHFSEGGTMDKTAEALEETRDGIWDDNELFERVLGPVIKKEVDLLKYKFNI